MAPSKLQLVLNLLSLQHPLAHAFQACPFLGLDLPAATNLANSPAVQNATSILKTRIRDGITSGLLFPNQTSFSVDIFSADNSLPFFEYHFSSPVLATSNGTKKVDTNSIYRIGSISKLFTVYTFLIEDGDAHFHEPITKYVPELLAASQEHPASDAANFVDWKSVTVGNLASQISGIGRDC
jgi:CubicO group peptidase (beta-lactamase class C family)